MILLSELLAVQWSSHSHYSSREYMNQFYV